MHAKLTRSILFDFFQKVESRESSHLCPVFAMGIHTYGWQHQSRILTSIKKGGKKKIKKYEYELLHVLLDLINGTNFVP